MTLEEALEKKKEIKRKLFEIRLEIELNSKDKEKVELLRNEFDITKKELATIHKYIMNYNEEKKEGISK